MALACCLLLLIEQNCILKTFLKALIDNSSSFLPVFPSRTNLRLHNVSVTPSWLKKS